MKLIRNLAFVRVALVPLARDQARCSTATTSRRRDTSRPPGRCSASTPRSPCCSSGCRFAGAARLRYLAALSVVTDFAIIDGPDVRLRVGAGPAPARAPVPGRAGGGALLPARRRVDRRRGRRSRPARPRSLAGGSSSTFPSGTTRSCSGSSSPLRSARSSGGSSTWSAARRTTPRSGRPRRSASATSSAAASTCSRRPAAQRARSARRSTSTGRSPRSRASCAACCRSTARRSCSPREAAPA